jgi:hypothetical protein
MTDGDYLIEFQGLYGCFKIAKLLLEAVVRALWFVRCAEAKAVVLRPADTKRG